MNEISVNNFDYSKLDTNISNYLQAKELRMRNLASNFYTETGKELKEAQDELAKNGYGCFEEWYESLGFKRNTVYKLIQRFDLTLLNREEQKLIEDLPLSLSYEISKPSAPKELVQAVFDGDIKSNKEYQEAIKDKKDLEFKAKQLEEELARTEQSRDIMSRKAMFMTEK